MKPLILLVVTIIIFSCKSNNEARKPIKQITIEQNTSVMEQNLKKYVSIKLTSDLSLLTANERKMLPSLIEAADKMNDLFWYEAYGDKNDLLNSISDVQTKEYAIINYGPWDRLNGNKSFVEGIAEKPLGANYYPEDMTKDEFNNSVFEGISLMDLNVF